MESDGIHPELIALTWITIILLAICLCAVFQALDDKKD